MKNKKSKKKNKAFMDFDSVCLGIEEDIMAYENSLNEIQEISDAEFFEQFNMVAKEMPPAPNSIVSQKQSEGEKKNSEKDRKRKTVTERFLVKVLFEKFPIGIYSKVAFIRIGDLYEELNPASTIRALNSVLEEKYLDQVTMRICEGVSKQVRALLSGGAKKLTVPETEVKFNNGTFDITTGEWVSQYEDVFSTVCIDASYYPDRKFSTPVWDAFLRDCSNNNPQIYDLIMTFVGYLLLPGTHAKNFFVLGTAKNSGKSKLAEFIRKLIPEESVCAIAIDDFRNEFVLAQVVGKTINFAMDMPGGNVTPKNGSVLKMITGNDPVTINAKYLPPFSHVLFSKLVFATNEMITSVENDPALWERMIIIPFLKSIPKEKQDPELLDKLWEERDGIVNKALRYAKRLVANNYRFPYCAVSERMKDSWMCGRCAGLYSFVDECCVIQDDVWIPTATLYEAYAKWCALNEYDAALQQTFARTLKDVFELDSVRHSVQGTQYRGISGITLKNI